MAQAARVVRLQKSHGAAFLPPVAVADAPVAAAGTDQAPEAVSAAFFAGMLLLLGGLLAEWALVRAVAGVPHGLRLGVLGLTLFGLLVMLVGFVGLLAAS